MLTMACPRRRNATDRLSSPHQASVPVMKAIVSIRPMIFVLLFALLAGCGKPSDVERDQSDEPPLTGSATFQFAFESFRQNFDRRAELDHTDKTSECNVTATTVVCAFDIAAFQRSAPTEAAAAVAEFGVEQMPDEYLNFGIESGRVNLIGLLGDHSTLVRRAHYIGQMETLVRTLSPGLTDAEVTSTINELHLNATPVEQENDFRVVRPWAIISCYQEIDPAHGYAINCQLEPPESAYPAGDRPLTAENVDRLANGTGADWTNATSREKKLILMTWIMNGDIAANSEDRLSACLDSEAVDANLRSLPIEELMRRCSARVL